MLRELPGELLGEIPGVLPGELPGELLGEIPGELPGELLGEFPVYNRDNDSSSSSVVKTTEGKTGAEILHASISSCLN